MSKIKNPVVLIHKRENSDTYAVAITSGSHDYHDAILMATMEPDITGDDVDTWSKAGYYMAAEIERLRALTSKNSTTNGEIGSWSNPINQPTCKTFDEEHVRREIYSGSNTWIQCSKWAYEKAKESGKIVRELYERPQQHSILNDAHIKPLIIPLPDTSSKAFWSGAGKNEVFHPESYKRWVKEAIERACVIAGIGVEVK